MVYLVHARLGVGGKKLFRVNADGKLDDMKVLYEHIYDY